MSGFNVSPQELREHSTSMAAIADGIADCRSASDEEGVGGLVYGILFDPTALPILSAIKNDLARLISAASDVGHGISTALAANADSYAEYEQTIHQKFQTLLAEVPPHPVGR